MINKFLKELVGALIACSIASCDKTQNYTMVSKPFELCAPLSSDIKYHIKSGIDSQRGFVESGSALVKIYINSHTNLSDDSKIKLKAQPAFFSLLQKKDVSSINSYKELYTYKQSSEYVFVELTFYKNEANFKLVKRLRSSLRGCAD